MVFADLGLTSILTRELTKNGEDRKAFFSTAFIVKIGFLLSTILITIILAPIISKFPEAKSLSFLIAIFVALESFRAFLYAITRAENKMEKEAGLVVVAEILSIVIVVVLFLQNPSIKTLAESYIIGNALGLIVTILLLRKSLVGVFSHFQKHMVLPIIRGSWPFAVMGIFGMFLTNIDTLMIGFWNNEHVLGLYAAAQKPIALLYILPGFLSASFFPIISKIIHETPEKTATFVGKSYRSALMLALPLTFGGIVLAQPLISVVFGPEYEGAHTTFQILLASLVPAFLGAIFSDILLAEDSQKLFIRSSIAGALTNVFLNILLIPQFGIEGSAVATLFAQIAINGTLAYRVRKKYFFSFRKETSKILLSSIAIGAWCYFLKSFSVPLFIIVPSGALLYIAILAFLKDKLFYEIKGALAAKTSA
jgi:O-antigen/teichoic acid export membrane protein